MKGVFLIFSFTVLFLLIPNQFSSSADVARQKAVEKLVFQTYTCPEEVDITRFTAQYEDQTWRGTLQVASRKPWFVRAEVLKHNCLGLSLTPEEATGKCMECRYTTGQGHAGSLYRPIPKNMTAKVSGRTFTLMPLKELEKPGIRN